VLVVSAALLVGLRQAQTVFAQTGAGRFTIQLTNVTDEPIVDYDRSCAIRSSSSAMRPRIDECWIVGGDFFQTRWPRICRLIASLSSKGSNGEITICLVKPAASIPEMSRPRSSGRQVVVTRISRSCLYSLPFNR